MPANSAVIPAKELVKKSRCCWNELQNGGCVLRHAPFPFDKLRVSAQAQDEEKLLMASRKTTSPELVEGLSWREAPVEGRNAADPALSINSQARRRE